jgi:hypothetical protein
MWDLVSDNTYRPGFGLEMPAAMKESHVRTARYRQKSGMLIAVFIKKSALFDVY